MTGFFRVEHGDGPEPTAEPGVQHVLVLLEVCGRKGRIDGLGSFESSLRSGFYHIAAVRQIIGRNALAPPQLAGNTPVSGVFHPVPVGIHVFLRDKLRTTAFYGLQGHLGKGFHLQEPLGAQLGLNNGVRALGIAHRRGVVFHLYQVAGFFQHFHNLLAGHKAVLAHQNLGFFVQFTVVVNDFQHGKVVTKANFIVVDVVCGGNLKATGTEVHLHVIVLNHGDFAVNERNEHLLALEPEMALVLGIHANGGIRHDGFRTGGGNDQVLVRGIAVSVGNKVFQVIEMALGVLVDDFVVAHGGEGLRIPVHHAYAFVNPAFLIKINKGVDYGLAQRGFHGEAGAVPVTGAT